MRHLLHFIFLFLILSSFLVLKGNCDMYEPFKSKEEKISLWKSLWDRNTNLGYTSIGKTYEGNDIWLFSVGNSSAPKILLDAEMHGTEDKGGEILFLLAEWLLESHDPVAQNILNSNFIMFIPIINDQYVRGNGNTETCENGVDINRNFETGWTITFPQDSTTYSGLYPGSEPETKTMQNVFQKYQPDFYLNMHCGAGPYAAYYDEGNVTLSEEIVSKMREICTESNIVPYRTFPIGSNGYAIGDAVKFGVKSAWIVECEGKETAWKHLPENYEELENVYFPKCLAILVAISATSSPYDYSKILTENQTDISLSIENILQKPLMFDVTSDDIVTVNATITGDTEKINAVILNYTVNSQGPYFTTMSNVDENLWMGQIVPHGPGINITYTIKVEDDLGQILQSSPLHFQYLTSEIPEFSDLMFVLFFITLSSFIIAYTRKKRLV